MKMFLRVNFNVAILGLLLFGFLHQAFSQNDVWIAKGEKAMLQKKFDDAVNAFSKVIEKDSNNVQVLSRRGQAYLFSQRFDKAKEDFTRWIELKPNADAYNYRGLAFGYIGDVENAIGDFEKAIQLDPKFTEAYLNRGSAYLSLKEVQKALDDFGKVISLDPKNPEVFYQRGRIYYNQGDAKKAIVDFSKAISLGLKNNPVYYSRGNSYYKSGDYQNAIKDYTKAIELDSTDSEALNNRAMAYDKSGNTKLANQDRERLNRISGNKFPEFETLTFKKFDDDKNELSIELPDTWNRHCESHQDLTEFFVTLEKIQKMDDFYSVGIRMSMNRNMSKNYNLPPGTDLEEFWQASALENTKDYAAYRIFLKKTMRINGYEGSLNKILIKVSEESVPIRMYEIVLTKNDDLFFAYFQAPEVQWGYFEKIFDKALKTLYIK